MQDSEPTEDQNVKQPIVLIGFMAAGKTSIGSLLAKKLNRKFLDLDQEIERVQGKSIEEIFQTQGEVAFRKIETEVCQTLGEMSNIIISTGGGIINNPNNMRIFKKHSLVIYLESSFEQIYGRLKKSKKIRPLFQKHSKEELLDLYRKRHPIYTQHADISIQTINSKKEILDQIINLIN